MFITVYRLINLINDSENYSTESHIAKTLLEHIKQIDTVSIDCMAEKCGISKSTLSKFIKKIGFDDYKEFRDNARNELKRSGYYGYEYKMPVGKFLEKESLNKYIEILINDLLFFEKCINKQQIQFLASAIYKCKKVATFGSVYSQTVAIDFMYRLAEEGKYIRTYTYDTKQEEYIKNLDKNSLVVIFSNSGQYIYNDGMRADCYFKSYLQNTKGEIALITSNEQAANDNIVKYPILYKFSTNVQSHMIIERLVMELIILEYKKIKNNILYK